MTKEHSLYDFNLFEFIETCFTAQDMICPDKHSICSWKECLFCTVAYDVLQIPITERSAMSFLIFCLAVHQLLREVLKITTIIMELSASLFSSVNFSFIYFEAVTGHVHTGDCCLPDKLFFYTYKMSLYDV